MTFSEKMAKAQEMARTANQAREIADVARTSEPAPRHANHGGLCPICHTRCYGDCTAANR